MPEDCHKRKYYVENSTDEMIFMDMLLYRSNEYFMQSYTFFLKYHTTPMDTINVNNLTYEIYIHVSFSLEKFYSIFLKNQFQFLKIC